MSEGVYAVQNRAEARDGLLSKFDDARDSGAMEAVIDHLLPHERARLQAQRDLEDDMAGRENGRLSRGGGFAQGRSAIASQRKAAERQASLTLTQLLLSAAYSALRDETLTLIDDTAREIENAIYRLGLMHDTALEMIAAMEDAALKTPDGEAVFFDSDENRYRYANGDSVDAATAATLMPKENADYPTWQDYSVATERAEGLNARIAELTYLRDHRLEPQRTELHQEIDPASHRRIEEIKTDTEAIRDKVRDLSEQAPDMDRQLEDSTPAPFSAPLPP